MSGIAAAASSSTVVAKNAIRHVGGDLMEARHTTPALCHCVSRCLAMGKGIAVLFKTEFGCVEQLKAQGVGIGGVAVLDLLTIPTSSPTGAAAASSSSPQDPHQPKMRQQSLAESFGVVKQQPAKASPHDVVAGAKEDEVTTHPVTADLQHKNTTTTNAALAVDAPLRYVYYLITKDRYFNKPTYDDLRLSLRAMYEHMVAHGVPHVGMPEIGCGLDMLVWNQVEMIIKEEMDRAVANHQTKNSTTAASSPLSSSLISTVYHYKPPAGSPSAVGEKRLRGGGGRGRGGGVAK